MEVGARSKPASRDSRRRGQPKFFEAVIADAATTHMHLGLSFDASKRLRTIVRILWLAWTSDSFLAQIIYRFGARMWGLGIPVVPRIARGITMMIAEMAIGDTVIMRPGVSISHGYVVIGGLTEIRSGTLIAPFVSIGLLEKDVRGPTIGRRCTIGTGSRVLGGIEIGDRAQIGANAVVVKDLPADAVAVGVPARLIVTD
jgi:serine O-acetyltransferase